MLSNKENQISNKSKNKSNYDQNPSKEYFENSIIKAKQNDENVIPIYKKYIEWISKEVGKEQISQEEFFLVVQDCCDSLKDEDKYKEDKGYLRIWLTFADMSDDQEYLFDFMRNNNIGTKHALFYVAWSTIFESLDDLEKAYLILKEGKMKKAEPESQIKTHIDEFQKRYDLNVNQKEEEKEKKEKKEFKSGYFKHLVYPNEKEEYSFEELRASLTKYQIKNDDDNSDDDLDFDLSDDELFISNRFSISNTNNNNTSNLKFRPSLGKLFQKPSNQKKEITIHTKSAEKEILDMFGSDLTQEDNFFQKKKKKKSENKQPIKQEKKEPIKIFEEKNEKISVFQEEEEEKEKEIDFPKKKKKKFEIFKEENENVNENVFKKQKLEIFEDSENLIPEKEIQQCLNFKEYYRFIEQVFTKEYKFQDNEILNYLRIEFPIEEFNKERIKLKEEEYEIIKRERENEIIIKKNEEIQYLLCLNYSSSFLLYEYYIELELFKRIKKEEYRFLKIKNLYFYSNVNLKLKEKKDSLFDYILMYNKNKKVMDEHLIMFYTIELLDILYTLHSNNFIHRNFDSNNLIIIFEQNENENWNNWNRIKSKEWKNKGLKLNNEYSSFIDLNLIKNSGNDEKKLKEKDIINLKNIVYFMLFGREYEEEEEGEIKLKKYWQIDLWKIKFIKTIIM
eukprot:gene323-6737_t